jgi:hypothetical protein
MNFRRVVLETPYQGNTVLNILYARACVRDCLKRGESPIAPHLLFPQPGILNDNVRSERELGISAGLAWGEVADATVVYVDNGISDGMREGIEHAKEFGRPVEFRKLKGWHQH